MKLQNLFLMTGLLMGVVACGGNDDAAQTNHYNPNDVYNVPQHQGNYNYQNTEQWMIQQLQGIFGNVQTFAHSNKLNLGAGTHSWQTIYDRIVAQAHASGCQTYTSYTAGSVLSRVNMTCLRNYIGMSGELSSRAVRYANDPSYNGYSLAHTVDQILSVFYSSYNYMYGSWYGGGYPYSYQPYWPSGNGISVGVGYSSGGGLSIGVGGSWNW